MDMDIDVELGDLDPVGSSSSSVGLEVDTDDVENFRPTLSKEDIDFINRRVTTSETKNVMLTASHTLQMSLSDLAMKIGGKYTHDFSAELYFRGVNPRFTALIFSPSSIDISGAVSHAEALLALRLLSLHIWKHTGRPFDVFGIERHLLMPTMYTGYTLDLQRLQRDGLPTGTMMPSAISKVKYQMKRPEASVGIFCSGSVVVSSDHPEEDVRLIFQKLLPMLAHFKVSDLTTEEIKMDSRNIGRSSRSGSVIPRLQRYQNQPNGGLNSSQFHQETLHFKVDPKCVPSEHGPAPRRSKAAAASSSSSSSSSTSSKPRVKCTHNVSYTDLLLPERGSVDMGQVARQRIVKMLNAYGSTVNFACGAQDGCYRLVVDSQCRREPADQTGCCAHDENGDDDDMEEESKEGEPGWVRVGRSRCAHDLFVQDPSNQLFRLHEHAVPSGNLVRLLRELSIDVSHASNHFDVLEFKETPEPTESDPILAQYRLHSPNAVVTSAFVERMVHPEHRCFHRVRINGTEQHELWTHVQIIRWAAERHLPLPLHIEGDSGPSFEQAWLTQFSKAV